MRALALAALLMAALPARGALPLDPARTHYLFAPSAFLLRGGEVVLSQTEAVFSSAALGIGEHVNVLAGSALPALAVAAGSRTFNLGLEVKAGLPFTPWLRAAAGFQSLTFPGVGLGYGYAVATFGHEGLHLTLGAGLPVASFGSGPSFGPPMVIVGAGVRLGRYFALAAENWLFPTHPELPMINAGLVRVMLGRFSLGLGAFHIDPLRIPLPWIDLAVRVGG